VILVVAATNQELDGARGAQTVVCGIGPVEAALATARAIGELSPSAILHVGIAGSRTLEPPAVVVGSESVYCDVVDPSSVIPRVERASPDPGLVAALRQALPDAHVGAIGTSASVGGAVGLDVEAMEGFGVLRAAQLAGVPAVELRTISNNPAERDRSKWRFRDALDALASAIPHALAAIER
jgi:predicted 5'-methylthioadenosine/S-adenosylhomocysteine nucleosidase